jgi:hypothetical protein
MNEEASKDYDSIDIGSSIFITERSGEQVQYAFDKKSGRVHITSVPSDNNIKYVSASELPKGIVDILRKAKVPFLVSRTEVECCQ